MKIVRTPNQTTAVFVEGEFIEGDVETFNSLVFSEKAALIFFNSPGGLLSVGVGIGQTIRLKGFATIVPDGFICASSCGLAWLAGIPKGIEGSGKVGFHAIHTIENGHTDVSSAGNALVGSYLARLGLSDGFIAYATTQQPNAIQWLSKEDAAALSLEVRFIDKVQPVEPRTAETELPIDGPDPVQKPELESDDTNPSIVTPTEPKSGGTPTEINVRNPTPFDPYGQWNKLVNTDLPGNDMVGMPLPSKSTEVCESLCKTTNGCMAYTQNHEFEKCFLKSGFAEALQFTGASSGFKGPAYSVKRIGREHGPYVRFRTGLGHEILSPPLQGFSGATLAWCQDKCIDQHQCQGFNFYPNGDCLLLSARKPTRQNTKVYSGARID